MKYVVFVSLIIVTIISCKQKSHSVSKTEVKLDTTQLRLRLEKSRKDGDDNYEILFNNDTLKIVTGNNFLFYPFGKHAPANDIFRQVTNAKKNKLWLKDLYNGDSTEVTQIKTSTSQVKLIFDKEQNRQEILSANIVDRNFTLRNNVRIGMNKNKLLSILFNNPSPIPTNVIKFISVVQGIKHYYYFKQDKLYQIKMITDYTLKDE